MLKNKFGDMARELNLKSTEIKLKRKILGN